MTTAFDVDFHDKITSVEENDRESTGSTQVIFKFTNGYAASIVQGPYTYGGPDGLFEMAVLDSNGNLHYDNPVTPDDVAGFLSVEEVQEKLHQLAHLTEAELTEFQTDKAKKEFLKALGYLAQDFRDVQRRTPDAITELPEELRSAVEGVLNYFNNQEEDNAC